MAITFDSSDSRTATCARIFVEDVAFALTRRYKEGSITLELTVLRKE